MMNNAIAKQKFGTGLLGAACCVVALVAALVAGAGSASALTHPVPDLDATGSVSISLVSNSGKVVPGGSLALYKVGNITKDDGSYVWTLTDEFADSGVDLSDISDPDIAEALADMVSGKTEAGTISIAKDGTGSISGLPVGAYLVVQKKTVEGFMEIVPFIVTIPLYQEEEGTPEGYGEYIYDVSASPKVLPVGEVEDDDNGGDGGDSDTKGADSLPQTGQLWWPVPVLLILGAALVAVGVIRNRRSEA